MNPNNRKDRRISATVTDRRHSHWLAAVLALFALSSPATGQAPPLATQTISLPSGPGSIEGLGESFEPQLNTGSYVFRLPFKLPPVRGKSEEKET